jgi:hypothetical protein
MKIPFFRSPHQITRNGKLYTILDHHFGGEGEESKKEYRNYRDMVTRYKKRGREVIENVSNSHIPKYMASWTAYIRKR